MTSAGLSVRDRKLLWGRAKNRCAFPQCGKKLIEDEADSTSGEQFESIIGDECHIHSASEDGPRFDPEFPKHKLETYENRILLCKADHARVDARDGRGYDAETLIEMKRKHEQSEDRRDRIKSVLRAYVADQFVADDRVRFRQAKLEGPRVDDMFVDVPMSTRSSVAGAKFLVELARDHPGDAVAEPGHVVTGAAQALLHPDWRGNALIVGGPGQGKSTLLQFICQFHRARFQDSPDYDGPAHGLSDLTSTVRIPIRLDLRDYAHWASAEALKKRSGPKTRRETGPGHDSWSPRRTSAGGPIDPHWPELEQFIRVSIRKHSGVEKFSRTDLATLFATEPILLALDGLDEVANLEHREIVANEVERATLRLRANSSNLIVIATTRPGTSKSPLWSSMDFPAFHLQRLTTGLRLQYLQRWCAEAGLTAAKADELQRKFHEREELPHIRDLASYPMQLAILLHLLHRRGLLPEQRTDLYNGYLEAFLDREETENKEPLLSSARQTIVDIHAFLGWYMQAQAETGQGAGRVTRDELQSLLRHYLDGQDKGQQLARRLFSAMEARTLCLIEREPGFFQFEVQSLREYFAARYVDQYAEPRDNTRVDCFDALLERPYWLNTARFLVGMFRTMEKRGIRDSLLSLQANGTLGDHPHLRNVASRLLDDRSYQGQPAAVVQDVVDYVLDGPGVVFADDGFLDESGQPLTFAEDAGRLQAIRHLRNRLLQEDSEGVRTAAARMLQRHTTPGDKVGSWWWEQFKPSSRWLRTAATLQVLDEVPRGLQSSLPAAVTASGNDVEWACEVLVRGGYAGSDDSVVSICIDELNDGAVEVIDRSTQTPLTKLVDSAQVAQLRARSSSASAGRRSRTRFRASNGRRLLADIVTSTESLHARPRVEDSAAEWRTWLDLVATLWGDGWILRQAVALVPTAVELSLVAERPSDGSAVLSRAISSEHAVRENRDDPVWWRHRRGEASTDLEVRHWLFQVLTTSHAGVITGVHQEIETTTSGLSPKHYRALEAAIRNFQQSANSRQLVLQEPLRHGRVTFSGKALSLIRLVATEATCDQIDKKLHTVMSDLLVSGMGDRRTLMRLVGDRKTTAIESLEHTRSALPAGMWADHVKLGAMKPQTAARVLQTPSDWPLEIVDLAIQQSASRLVGMPPLHELAERNRWFESSSAQRT